MQRSFIFFILFSLLFPLFAQKRAFTIEDLYKIKSVRDPQFSPDGKKIVFTVTQYFLEKGKSNSDIYLMNADGSNLRQLTYHPMSDFHPRWSPDGRRLLFLSNRGNGVQAWQLSMEGGDAQQLTDFATGVNDAQWSSDGKHLVFYSRVFPECGADEPCNEELNKKLDNGIVQAHLADDLLYRHWDIWKDGTRLHTFVFNIETGECRDLTPGEMDAPAFMTGGTTAGFTLSPDGKEVCYVANPDSNRWETTNKDLWLVPINGGESVNITDENEAYDAHPRYSPDGRYIAYIMQKVPRYESDLMRLAIYVRRTKERIVLTEEFDYWVDNFHWSPDSRSIYFTAEVKGRVPLYKVSIQKKEIEEVVNFDTIDDFMVSPEEEMIAGSRRSVGEPREIWSAKINGKDKRRLTRFNQTIEKEVDIRPAEEMWIPSPTGQQIHTFIVKPYNFDPNQKYPLILNVHGGPQGQWTDGFRGDWQVYPGAGYVVAFSNPHGSSGYGQEFTRAISGDWAGKVYKDVMAVTDSLANLSYVDEDRMGAMGWSYGGYMMMWLEGHTERFKAIASMMGLYNLTSFYGTTEELWFPQYDLSGTPWNSVDYDNWSPHHSATDFKTPCLVITGEKDFRVSYTQSVEFFNVLQKMGVPSRLIVFENDGHWPGWVKSMPVYYNAHLDWFHKYLGGDPAPYDVKKMIRNQIFDD